MKKYIVVLCIAAVLLLAGCEPDYDAKNAQRAGEQHALEVAEEAYQSAYSDGYEDGYSDGCDDGYSEGYGDGYSDGTRDQEAAIAENVSDAITELKDILDIIRNEIDQDAPAEDYRDALEDDAVNAILFLEEIEEP